MPFWPWISTDWEKMGLTGDRSSPLFTSLCPSVKAIPAWLWLRPNFTNFQKIWLSLSTRRWHDLGSKELRGTIWQKVERGSWWQLVEVMKPENTFDHWSIYFFLYFKSGKKSRKGVEDNVKVVKAANICDHCRVCILLVRVDINKQTQVQFSIFYWSK